MIPGRRGNIHGIKDHPRLHSKQIVSKDQMDEELDALLATSARDDGSDPEFEELWSDFIHRTARPPPQPPALAMARTTGPSPTAKPRPPAPGAITRPLTRPPRVGTLVQRSSGNQAKKLAALMATPPPLPRRRVKKPIRPIQPAQPIPAKDRLTELFGDTLSDVSDEEQPKEVTPPAVTAQGQATEPDTRTTAEPNANQGHRTSHHYAGLWANHATIDGGRPGTRGRGKRATFRRACHPAVQDTGGRTALHTALRPHRPMPIPPGDTRRHAPGLVPRIRHYKWGEVM